MTIRWSEAAEPPPSVKSRVGTTADFLIDSSDLVPWEVLSSAESLQPVGVVRADGSDLTIDKWRRWCELVQKCCS